jgi:hypothetical protein
LRRNVVNTAVAKSMEDKMSANEEKVKQQQRLHVMESDHL